MNQETLTSAEIEKEALYTQTKLKFAYSEMVKENNEKFEEYQATLENGKNKMKELIKASMPMFAIKATVSEGSITKSVTVGVFTHREIAIAKKDILEKKLGFVFKNATDKVIVTELIKTDERYPFLNNIYCINDEVCQYDLDKIVALCKENFNKKRK